MRKSKFIYIGFLFFVVSCSSKVNNEQNRAAEDKVGVEDFDGSGNIEELSEEISAIRSEEIDLEFNVEDVDEILKQKLQEIIDLSSLIKDSTLPREMRDEAQKVIYKITKDSSLSLSKGRVTNFYIEFQDSNKFSITFSLLDKVKKAEAIINKETISLDDELMENVEVTIEEIK